MEPEKASGPAEAESVRDDTARHGRRPRKVWPIAVGVAAVLAVGGGTAWLVQGSSASHRGSGAPVGAAPSPSGIPTAGGSPVAPGGPGKGGPSEARGPQGSPPAGRASGPVAYTYMVDGTRLTVGFWAGVCEKFALRTDESQAGRVSVRIVVDRPVPKGQVCPMVIKFQTVSAELAAPLGGRSVVDAATGTVLRPDRAPVRLPLPGGGAVTGAPR